MKIDWKMFNKREERYIWLKRIWCLITFLCEFYDFQFKQTVRYLFVDLDKDNRDNTKFKNQDIRCFKDTFWMSFRRLKKKRF